MKDEEQTMVGVSLDMVLGDLSRWHPEARWADRALSRNLRFCVPAKGRAIDSPDILYVVKRREAVALSGDYSDCVNLVIVGCLAEEEYARFRSCNVVSFDVSETAYETILGECIELFARYSEGVAIASELIVREKSFDEVASACSELIARPLLVWGFAKDCVLYSTHSNPLEFALAGGGEAVSEVLRSAIAKDDECFVLPAGQLGLSDLQPSLLCRPVCVKDDLAVALLVECGSGYQVGRDESVLGIIASLLQNSFKHGAASSFALSNGLSGQIELLLNRSVTSWQLLESVLAEYGWNLLDEYLCIMAVSEDGESMSSSSLSGALATNDVSPELVCLPYGRGLMFVANLSCAGIDRRSMVSYVESVLKKRRRRCILGVSLPFSELQDLYYYGFQAMKALELGRLLDPGKETSYFEDHFLDYVAQCCLGSLSATALFPAGYNRLRNYGRSRGGSSKLGAFLDHYVENDFEMKKTISSEYCSRTTAFSKLKRIKEITGMDLDDPSTRAALLIATRAIRLTKLQPK